MPTFNTEPIGVNTPIAPAVYALPTLESVVNAYNTDANSILTNATPLISSLGAIPNRNAGVQKMSVFNSLPSNTSSPNNALAGNTSNVA